MLRFDHYLFRHSFHEISPAHPPVQALDLVAQDNALDLAIRRQHDLERIPFYLAGNRAGDGKARSLVISTITAAIMGVGATRRLTAVRWGVAGNIVTGWVLTFPGAGLAAGLCAVLLAWVS